MDEDKLGLLKAELEVAEFEARQFLNRYYGSKILHQIMIRILRTMRDNYCAATNTDRNNSNPVYHAYCGAITNLLKVERLLQEEKDNAQAH